MTAGAPQAVATAPDTGVTLAAHVAATTFAALPPPVVAATKRCILDTVAVMIAAGPAPGVAAFVETALEQGGAGEATILGHGLRTSAAMAAFANGAMGHLLDYDEYHPIGLHACTSTVPAALAVAEQTGASGADVLAAVTLANDISLRLAAATERAHMDVPGRAWYASPLLGYFGATLAAGKVLGLDAERLFHALGIVSCQVGGAIEMVYSPGSFISGLNAAWPAKAGVLAALLAQRGVPGVPTAFDGRFGFFNMFFGGEHEPDRLLEGLGERYLGEQISFKPWPACGGTHGAIDAALRLVAAHDIAVDEIREIGVTVRTQPAWNLCVPEASRQRPTTVRDAKFSMQFVLATAIAKRRATLADFTADALGDERVLDLAAKVRPEYDEDPDAPNAIVSPLRVTLKTARGTFADAVEHPRGRWPNALSDAELAAKFRDCVAHAVAPIGPGEADAAVALVDRLEGVADIRELTAVLRGSPE